MKTITIALAAFLAVMLAGCITVERMVVFEGKPAPTVAVEPADAGDRYVNEMQNRALGLPSDENE